MPTFPAILLALPMVLIGCLWLNPLPEMAGVLAVPLIKILIEYLRNQEKPA